ncbi:MAG TPA: Zn-dependent hydrolase [Chloroflexota bacterium]|jgi:allantoate deiminase|nr:Zn-dependent hydrolase [Chloroflexota bacterium]
MAAQTVTIDGQRIQSMLDELHAIGRRPSGGTFRGLYSQSWRQAHARIKRWMAEAGLDVRVDAVGNIWGHVLGREPGRPIVAGSHYDTVPDGGKYDGQLGHVGALVAVDSLRRQLGQPRRSLAVLATCEEEGSRFNCNFWAARALTGEIAPGEAEVLRDFEGVLLADEMRASGFDPARVTEAATSQIAAFLELHIEQGPVLARLAEDAGAGAPRVVGAVTAITGIGRLMVTLTGQPDHTGTTPMLGRRDALLGAAEIALALREMALGVGHPAVMTVARMELTPNIPNVVAGQVRFTVDARHPDRAVQLQLMEAARQRALDCARSRALECQAEEIWDQPPVAMALELVAAVRAAVEARGYRAVDIVAGAGHDSQVIGRKFPAAMIFTITGNGGRSHCPDEYASPQDCQAGVEVLAETLRRLAY